MQTFLPFEEFEKTAKALDSKRLNKQRIEAYQILAILCRLKYERDEIVPRTNTAWLSHPAVRMWQNHELTLLYYLEAVNDEWVGRGGKDHALLYDKAYFIWLEARSQKIIKLEKDAPLWLGNQNFHTSHQSNLLKKDISYYIKHFQSYIPMGLPYIWPLTQCPVCHEWGRTANEIFHLEERHE